MAILLHITLYVKSPTVIEGRVVVSEIYYLKFTWLSTQTFRTGVATMESLVIAQSDLARDSISLSDLTHC